MVITQKCQYALRALFELAKREEDTPMKIGEIAQAQGIPSRFLENILNGLKSGGFVDSLRGKEGGYRLARSPESVTVGEIIRFVQGPVSPTPCEPGDDRACAPLGLCVFRPLWERAKRALESVYDGTSLADLVRDDAVLRAGNRLPCGGTGPPRPGKTGSGEERPEADTPAEFSPITGIEFGESERMR
jgi:Rrf2 family protein